MSNLELLQKLFGDGEAGEIKRGERLASVVYESVFESQKWCEELPYLQFRPDWQVKITPAFAGAVIRFRVRKATTPGNLSVSVYFDGYENLGYGGEPYWEVYPAGVDMNDIERFGLGEEKDMLDAIEASLIKMEARA